MLLVVCQLSRDVIGCEDCKRDGNVNVTSNSPSQDYTHPDDHNLPNYDMTPGFKPFTKNDMCCSQIRGLKNKLASAHCIVE